MDHTRIEAEQIRDRYLMGRLPAEDLRLFEAHFVDCPTCLSELEALESLRKALKELPPAEQAPAGPEEPVWHGGRWLPGARGVAALLAASLLVAVMLSLYLLRELQRTRLDLESSRRTSEGSERTRAQPSMPAAAAVFPLSRMRGAEPGRSLPDNRIVLEHPSEWVVLVVDRPAAPGFHRFAARLSRDDGVAIGEVMAPSPASSDQLAVALPSSLLPDGDYLLTLEGSTASGRVQVFATYRFRAERKS